MPTPRLTALERQFNKEKQMLDAAAAKGELKWGDHAYYMDMLKKLQKRDKARAMIRGEVGERPAGEMPQSADIRKRTGTLPPLIYTSKTLRHPSGRMMKGAWVTASDAEGEWGGPYANIKNLFAARREERTRRQRIESAERRAQQTRRSKSKSSSRSRSRSRSRSKSGSR
jgi:hypothetical protein